MYGCPETDRVLRLNTLQKAASRDTHSSGQHCSNHSMGIGLLLAGQALSKTSHGSSE